MLELGHLLAYHGLGDAELLGGAGEGTGIHHRGEVGQAIEVHGRSLNREAQ